MAIDVVMPQMGESIAEGTVVRWLKKVGETVERDEPLLEISTDKVDAEIPSPAAGTLTEILAQQRANIVETIHNRSYYGVSLAETVIDVTLETRGATHITAISHALSEAGFRFERIL